jgi:hypothetical protein
MGRYECSESGCGEFVSYYAETCTHCKSRKSEEERARKEERRQEERAREEERRQEERAREEERRHRERMRVEERRADLEVARYNEEEGRVLAKKKAEEKRRKVDKANRKKVDKANRKKVELKRRIIEAKRRMAEANRGKESLKCNWCLERDRLDGSYFCSPMHEQEAIKSGKEDVLQSVPSYMQMVEGVHKSKRREEGAEIVKWERELERLRMEERRMNDVSDFHALMNRVFDFMVKLIVIVLFWKFLSWYWASLQ